jgi:hypothetical protein
MPAVKDPGTGQLEVVGASNFTTVQQAPAAATLTKITGSEIALPINKLRIGAILRWRFNMAKTAAGSASSTFDIRLGTLGTSADAAVITFTKPAGTAAADEGYVEIEATIRGPLSASGKVVGTFKMVHNLAATGHAIIPAVVVTTVSGNVDLTVAGLIATLSVTSGAADAITIEQVSAELLNNS